ncbi:MAG TPA: hypothetical protein VHB21_14500 [Minicystis sp.]|nr:hypothetical protein [Minicystis sp.]
MSDAPKSTPPEQADRERAGATSARAQKRRANDPKRLRDELTAAARDKPLPPDPLSPESIRKMGLRLGIPLLVIWVLAFVLTGALWPKLVALGLTLALGALVVWILRTSKKSRKVAQIVKGAETPEARKEAIEQLEGDAKKGDAAAIFAKAQLQMQEDPRAALATLEQINLQKVMAPTADEARGQRAMIHLLLGETDAARGLSDGIDLSRHKEPKAKAMLAAIVGEAQARTGAAKKAIELLETFDPEDEAYADLKPQLLRARAFAYAWANNTKQMKQMLRRLSSLNPQYLTQFVTNKRHPGGVPPRGVHPLLEKEAIEMFTRSGAAPRRMEYKRG